MSMLIDTTTGLPYIEHDGVQRIMGCLPTPDNHKMKAATRFKDKFPLIPRSQWVDKSNFGFIGRILDQKATSSCCGHGTNGGFTGAWNASGRMPELFSPTSIYALCNNGVDHGANVGDCLTALEQYGICLESDVPEGMLFQNQFPPSALATAAKYKATEALYCPTYDELGSAVQMDMFPVFGIDIGGNFNPDSNGMIPQYQQTFQYQGHCLYSSGMLSERLMVPNSWSYNWGVGGICYIDESYFQQPSPDTWVILVGGVTDDNPLPPPA
jgi:hypothetical protein